MNASQLEADSQLRALKETVLVEGREIGTGPKYWMLPRFPGVPGGPRGPQRSRSYLFEEVLEQAGDVVGRDVRQLHLLPQGLEGLAQPLDAGL